MLPRHSFVLGGARSGKSRLAETLVLGNDLTRVYIATAQAFDDEMIARIDAHLDQRGTEWRTIEAPLDVVSALASVRASEIVLLDCATLWLSNHMLAENDLALESDRLLTALEQCKGAVVVVSNEVGQGIVPDNAMARQFRDEHGRLNQRLAAWADLAVLVVAGLPMVLKGTMP